MKLNNVIYFLMIVISLNVSADTEIRHLIKTYLPSNPIIVDAGAHIGNDTCKTAALWPEAQIYAFEPVPELFARLQKNTQQYPTIQCFPLALGEKTGIARLYVSSGASDMSSSLLKPKEHLKIHPDVFFTRSLEVNTINLDQWADLNGIDHVDLLWLSTQGSELSLLKAAPKILKTVTAIYMTVQFYETYAQCPLYAQVRTWLESQGFSVMHEDVKRWYDFGYVLFVKK